MRSIALLAALGAAACGTLPASVPVDATVDTAADAAPLADKPAPDGTPADRPPVDTTAQTFTYSAGPWRVAPGGEDNDKCESWTLHNEEPLYVNVVEMDATPGMHHSNWFFVPEANYPGPDGTWSCDSRGFDQGAASAVGGVFFAQSTQVTREAQRFPAGTAFVVPPHARVIGQLHLLNASAEARDVRLSLTVHTLRRSEVQTRLSPFYLEYHPLDIPARSRAQFDVSCDLDPRARAASGAPLSMRFFYGLAHYHELGSTMRVSLVGGARDGETLYETSSRQGESWARTMAPPVDVTGATGFKLTCVFENPRSTRARYGIGQNEMCIWLGYTDSPWQWAARAPGSARNTVVETRDGTIYNTAPCTEVIALQSRFLNE
ncbi:MAG: hypothetical protein U0324_43080 [Polyangiales bacterium]